MTSLFPPLAVFKTWLEMQPHGSIIGERIDCAGCPLARWLEVTLHTLVAVDEETIVTERYGAHETPEPYRRVIQAIDFYTYTQHTSTQVTAYECLTAVRDILSGA